MHGHDIECQVTEARISAKAGFAFPLADLVVGGQLPALEGKAEADDPVTRALLAEIASRMRAIRDAHSRSVSLRSAGVPRAGVLVTDGGREGRMAGADVERFAGLVAATRHPLLASGGVADRRPR